MKTKFSALLKIKKNDFKIVEDKISTINYEILQKEEEISSFDDESRKLQVPPNGSMLDLKLFNMKMNMQLQNLRNLNLQLNGMKLQKKEIQEELRLANIEVEKIKYLENEIVQKRVIELKKQENKDMDEIAINLFSS